MTDSTMFEEAFGTSDLDLYKDVLKVAKDCTPSQLRKGYYKQALKFHPDKNKSREAKLKFQAISWAYSVCHSKFESYHFLFDLILVLTVMDLSCLCRGVDMIFCSNKSKLLKDPNKRKQYDEDGVIPFDDDDDETNEQSKKSWKDYFDLIFGKVSTDDIDSFARKYKMSDEEEKDVLENYVKFKG